VVEELFQYGWLKEEKVLIANSAEAQKNNPNDA
jgi:hypothetical protein